MRDALTLVDQAISYCQGEISNTGVIDMLGVPEQTQVFELLTAMAHGDLPLVLSLVDTISDHTPDYSNMLDSLLSTLHRVAIAQAAPNAVDNSFGDKQAVLKLATAFTAEDIQLFYQLGIKGRSELRSGLDMRSAFEMLLLRMMIFSPSLVEQNLMPSEAGSDNGDLQTGQPNDQNSETASDRSLIDAARELAVSEPTKSVQSTKKKTLADQCESNSVGRQNGSVSKSVRDDRQPPAEGLHEHTVSEVCRSDLLRTLTHESWMEIFPSLPVSGIVGNILANTQCAGFEGGILKLKLAKDQSALYSAEILPKLENALNQYFCEPVSLKIAVGVVDVETPALKAQRLTEEAYQCMVNDFETDTNVRELLDRFAATVEEGSIVSLDDEGLAYD